MQTYLDEDGLRWEINGWHEHGKEKRYLIKYTRPGIHDRCSHALVGAFWMPWELLHGFRHPSELKIGSPGNCAGWEIRIQNIMQVLDIASYCPWEAESIICCTDQDFSFIDHQWYERTARFNDFFLLIQWKDEDDFEHVTWEFAETLMNVMDQDHCLSLLARWACEADHRHDQLLSNTPAQEIQKILGPLGWQYL